MELDLVRFSHKTNSTMGILTYGDFACFTLEDEYRAVKVLGKTRIPAGRYPLALRTAGKMHKRYSNRFGFHRGMLHILNIPDFEWVYIHIGNDHEDTQGCPLVGYAADLQKHEIMSSTPAYTDLYLRCMGEMPTHINIRDHI